MANKWTDKRVHNNENSQHAPLKTKENLTNGSRSVKKQIFGELKNVMHNQVGATPLKGNAAKIDGLPSVFNPNKSLCSEVLRKQQMKQNKLEKHEIAGVAEHYKEPVFDESLFDCWDIDRVCCKQQRSDEEIWSEMNMLDIGGFKLDTSIDDDVKKDFEAPILIPELETFPDIVDFDMEQGAAAVDFKLPGVQLPSIFDFIDELPF